MPPTNARRGSFPSRPSSMTAVMEANRWLDHPWPAVHRPRGRAHGATVGTVQDANPSKFVDPERPVENVSWKDAQSFRQTLDRKFGLSMQLPTEPQWEYGCRAGTTDATYAGPLNIRVRITLRFRCYCLVRRQQRRRLRSCQGPRQQWLVLRSRTFIRKRDASCEDPSSEPVGSMRYAGECMGMVPRRYADL